MIDRIVGDAVLGRHLTAPSVSCGSANLYLRGALEEETRPNLQRVSEAWGVGGRFGWGC